MTMGIYRIICLNNEKYYIGSSINIENRFSRHKCDLKHNRHGNILLQRSYNKYGKDSFRFEIIKIVKDKNNLLNIEQEYLDKIDSNYFNIGKFASGGDNITNHPKKLEIKDKISKTLKDKYSKMSKEERKEKFGKPKYKNGMWKGGITSKIYFCICGKEKSKESNKCKNCVNKKKDNNSFYNKKHTKETKDILSKKAIEKFNNLSPKEKANKNPQIKKVLIEGDIYYGVSEASRNLNVCPATIIFRIKSKNPKFKNYKYID